jgi:hypothetical protein
MDFNDRCACPTPLEPHKRVLYSHGLVLGVGELKTEQGYLLGKQYGHNRRLHGYGTGSGLSLAIRYLADGPECVVQPGWAVDPHGREICVHEAQCAKLNQWLAQQQQDGDLSSPFDASGVATVEAFVLLCYRECETDKVPIPVGPCLSLDKAMVPSRLEDAFELRLVTEAPPQPEEDAARRLGDILSRVSIASGSGGLTTADALVAEIRAIPAMLNDTASIPSIPDDLSLDPAFAEEIIRAGLRVFVTEVRPMLVPDGGACLNGPRDRTCLLLGRLEFDFINTLAGPQVVTDSVLIDERRRPMLMPTRLIQEAMLSDMLPGLAGAGSAPLIAVPSGTPALFVSPIIISLTPGTANLEDLASADVFGGIPSIRFRRNGAGNFGTAVFPFSVPPGLPVSARVRLRLHWAFTRPASGSEIATTWEAALRLQSTNAPIDSTGTPVPVTNIPGPTPDSSNNRLLTTSFVELPRGAAVNPALGFLSLSLRTPGALPANFAVHLLFAELEFAPGATP